MLAFTEVMASTRSEELDATLLAAVTAASRAAEVVVARTNVTLTARLEALEVSALKPAFQAPLAVLAPTAKQ